MVKAVLIMLCAFLGSAAPSAFAGGGNSTTATLCQKGGWETWRRTDGSAFENQGACVSYGAQGGSLATFTASTSNGVTTTRVDLPLINRYETRVLGLAGPTPGVTVYDQEFFVSPLSQEVSVAFAEAKTAVVAWLTTNSTQGQILVSEPSLFGSSDSTDTAFAGTRTNHVETTTATTTTLLSNGTIVINTDTHTEFFVDELYQTTVTSSYLYTVSGSVG